MVLITSDIQTFYRENYKESGLNPLDSSCKFIAWCFEYAHDNGITKIFHGADLLEKARPHVEVETKLVNLFNRLYLKYPAITFFTSTGNHDIPKGYNFIYGEPYPKTILNVLQEACMNFTIADYNKGDLPISVDDCEIFMVPFFRSELQFKECLEDIVSTEKLSTYKHLIMHQDISEEVSGSQISAYDPIFNHFDKVFNGHIHRANQLRKHFFVLGSPMEMKGGDALYGETKYVYNLSNNDLDKIPVAGYPVFVEYVEGAEIKEEDVHNYIKRTPKPIKKSAEVIEDDSTNESRNKIVIRDFGEDLSEEAAAILSEVVSNLSEDVDNEQVKKNVVFHSIIVEGIRSVVKPLELDLDRYPLTYYFGDYGSGKSTMLIFSLYWALTGQSLTGKQDDLATQKWLSDLYENYRGSRVIVKMSINDVIYYVSRHLSYRGKTFGETGGSNFLVFDEDQKLMDLNNLISFSEYPDELKSGSGEKLSGKKLVTKQWELLSGITPSILLNAVLFNASRSTLVQSSSTERHAVLSKILNVSWVKEVEDTIKGTIRELKHKIEIGGISLESDRKLLETLQSSSDTLLELKQGEIEAITKRKSDLLDNISVMSLALATKNSNLRDSEIKLGAQVIPDETETEKRISVLKSKKNEFRVRLSELELAVDCLDKNDRNQELTLLIKDAKELLYQRQQDIDQAIIAKDSWSTKLEKYHEEVNKLNSDLTKVTTDRDVCFKSIKGLSEQVMTASGMLDSLKESKCPMCDQDFHDEDLINEHQTNLDNLKKDGRDKQAEIVKLDELIEKLSHSIVGKRVELDPIMSALTESENIWNNFKDLQQETRDLLISLETEHKSVDAQLNNLLSNLSDKSDLELGYSQLVANKGKVVDEISKIDLELSELQAIVLDPEVQAKKELIAKLQKDVDDYTKDIEKLGTDLANYKYQLESLSISDIEDKYLEKLKEAQAKYDTQLNKLAAEEKHEYKLKTELELHEEIAKKVLRSNKLERKVINTKLVKLNNYAVRYGSILGITLDISLDDKNNYVITVIKEGQAIESNMLSDGETLITNLIWLFSLNDLCNEIVNFNIMQIDEPFKNLNGEAGNDVVNLIIEKSKDRNLHIITHAESLDLTGASVVQFMKQKGFYTEIV